jgi:PPP family 3-phenylpropionic acid transporter
MGLILPYIETYAMEHLQRERFGKSRLYGSIGFMIIAIVLAKQLTSYVIGINYFIFAISITLFFGVAITFKNEAFKKKIELERQEKFSLLKAKYIWISLFFMQISFGAFYNFFTIYETAHGVSLEMVSYLWSFGVICEIIFFYYQAPLLKLNLVNILKFSVSITIIRWLLLYFFPDSITVSFLSQSLHAVSFALHHTVAISLLYSVYQNKKLAAQFYYGFSFGLGGFLGAILAGIFYGPYLYLYAAIMAVFSLISLFLYQPKSNIILREQSS